MISSIIGISWLVRCSALTFQQQVVPGDPLPKERSEDKKEATFSFTREVLQAWTPGRKAAIPRLKFAPVVTPDYATVRSARAPLRAWQLNPDKDIELPKLTLGNAASTRHGIADYVSEEIAKEKSLQQSKKAVIHTANEKLAQESFRTTAQPPQISHSAHEFKTNLNDTDGASNTYSDTGPGVAGPLHSPLPAVAYHAAGISEKRGDFIAMLFVVAVLILVSCCVAVIADFDSNDYGIERKDLEPSPRTSQVTVKTLNDLQAAVANAHGSWAQNYKVADGKRKMALELVFRCSIIPQPEFCHSIVSQEHIDECIWIASNMLRQRSVEEWVDHWVEARATFDESVTACFQARTKLMDPAQPASFTAPRSVLLPGSNRQPHDVSPPRQNSQEEAVLSKDSAGESLLVVRCREIMASQKLTRGPEAIQKP